ncbi:MAG: ribosomal protein S18-alanine N-acetyltransferase [Anaerolineaceae bacterium]|nr:ribosomal protein S18-alanine N-acetyltransferase [Anaerolineaceae bacterium]
MSVQLRPMRPEDIDQVAAIDTHCFRPPWPKRSWRDEIGMRNHSHLVVLCDGLVPRSPGWRRHLRLPGTRTPTERVVGYGGMWLIAGEAHISTLATHPDHRGLGYGELLLAALIRRALARQASSVVLEVRESNRVARNLYHKFGFRLYGMKAGYYREGNENGCDMRLELGDAGARDRVLQHCNAIRARVSHVDAFNLMPQSFGA